jgi:hypothetical protein
MQSQLTLKLFTFYILKSQFKKKQYIIYFYKNTLLNNFLLNFSYKYTNICIQNPYINYINIVLPFFNKLIQQNYLIFFKTFQSFKKQNKQIIKKNQKRYLNNFSLNSFVKKKQQNNQLILNSFNF